MKTLKTIRILVRQYACQLYSLNNHLAAILTEQIYFKFENRMIETVNVKETENVLF